MRVFPVRHHSPAAASQLTALLRARPPRLILVEGPSDADALIPLVADPATRAPVALYAYRTERDEADERPQAVYYPLCDYSPELVAIRVGAEVGAEVRFCDVPAGVALATDAPGPDQLVQDDPALFGRLSEEIAAAAGFLTFDAWWEATVEQRLDHGPIDNYLDVLRDYGDKVRSLDTGTEHARHVAREAHMARAVLDAVAAGTSPDEIVLVCGAAHAVTIERMVAEDVPAPALPEAVPVAHALVAYSYPRLSEQLGYGAGNRAPWLYQDVWARGGDFATSTRRALVLIARRLREDGAVASLAQAIDADRLASTLAHVRGKPAPGVEEIEDAARACLAQGNVALVSRAVTRTLIGDAVGQVTPEAGRTPLQVEFLSETGRLRIPVVDEPRQLLVHLPVTLEREQSVFFHRLAAAEVPFAIPLQTGLGQRGGSAHDDPLVQLGRPLEKWDVQWTPATDAKLVEQHAWGTTIVEVCERRLTGRVQAASEIDGATEALLRMALCDLRAPFETAFARCERLAAGTTSFPPLARAAYHLAALVAYGATRRLPEAQVAELGRRLFDRAALQLPAAAVCGDEDAERVETALLPLFQLARRPGGVDGDLLWSRVATVSERESAHPRLRGLCLSTLHAEGRLTSLELGEGLRSLLATPDAAAQAHAVAGVFAVNRAALVRDRGLVAAVTTFLAFLSIERLIPLLPALRRTFGGLAAAERAYLTETLGEVLGRSDGRPAPLPPLSAVAHAHLAELDAEVTAVLAGWEERYGIA